MKQNIQTSSSLLLKRWAVYFGAAAGLLLAQNSLRGESTNGISPEQYLALPLAKNTGEEFRGNILRRYAVPFMEEILPLTTGGSAQVAVGAPAKRIFLLGMTDTDKLPSLAQFRNPSSPSSLIPNTPCRGWADPRDTSVRIFVGDHLGQIRLNYADGSSQVFPLILGEGVWWGRAFYDYQEPFPTDARLRQALASALRLYPPEPVPDGNYVAVIVPKPLPDPEHHLPKFPGEKRNAARCRNHRRNGADQRHCRGNRPCARHFSSGV